MRYAMFDVEVTVPLRDLPLSSEDGGAAILVRRKSVPVAFWMQATNGEGCITATALAQKIAADAGARIIAEAIREELAAPAGCAAPSVTIAICTRDRPGGVTRLLNSLFERIASLPRDIPTPDVLVVDNAPSDDRTCEVARRYPAVRYVREPRAGLNFARNRAVKESRGEILAFLDDDVIPDRGWFEGLGAAWSSNRDAAAFTGQVLPMELETDAQIIFEKRGGFRRGFERIRFGPVSPGDSFYPGGAGNFGAGANMAFRTRVLEALGGFDEALDTGADVPGGGDLDIFYRIIRAGYPLVYEPRFMAFHEHRRDMDELSRQYRRSWGLGFMCYLTKCLWTDPERRVNVTRLIVWWFSQHTRDLLGHLKKRLRRQEHIPPSLLIGELWGGVVGLLGGYARSRRRVDEIRRQVP